MTLLATRSAAMPCAGIMMRSLGHSVARLGARGSSAVLKPCTVSRQLTVAAAAYTEEAVQPNIPSRTFADFSIYKAGMLLVAVADS
jgi:hypothetical protein